MKEKKKKLIWKRIFEITVSKVKSLKRYKLGYYYYAFTCLNPWLSLVLRNLKGYYTLGTNCLKPFLLPTTKDPITVGRYIYIKKNEKLHHVIVAFCQITLYNDREYKKKRC